MRKEAKLLLEKAINSLVLSIEHFNRPLNIDRTDAVLIFLDHSFEMLLKAAILYKGGRIRERRVKETYGFDNCIRKCLTDSQVKFLTDNQALILRIINNLRDATMHYIIQISEQQLYLHMQAGVTLFDDLLHLVFKKKLADYLPERILPVSTKPPNDIILLIDKEFSQIKNLIAHGVRQRTQAKARLRPIAIIENTIAEQQAQPGEGDLNQMLTRLAKGERWSTIFPGVATLHINTTESGPNISIRISKKEGSPIKLVKEGEKVEGIVAVKRVNEFDYYSMGLRSLTENLGLNIGSNRVLAVIEHLGIQKNSDYFKEISIGSSKFKRYSKKAMELLKVEIPKLDMENLWNEYKKRHYKAKRDEF